MNRLAVLLLSVAGICLQAQSSSTITISTSSPGARFTVDGAYYTSAANFNWPTGSKHTLVFITDPPLPGQTVSNTQTTVDGGTLFAFGGWVDNAGLLLPGQDPIQIITASPQITSIKANVTVSYKVYLNFFNPTSLDPNTPPTCGAPGQLPPSQFRVGVVFVGQQCYWASATVFVPANSLVNLNAFPYPGFVFLGWSTNLGAPDAYLRSITVKGPLTIAPQFSPAKRVHFLTSPLSLNLMIDRSQTPTRSIAVVDGPCPVNEQQPIVVQTGFPPLCFGDFDFAPGSTHVISGVTPQLDTSGRWWIFDSWSNGLGPNALYTADTNTSSSVTLTGNFVRGASVSFVTSPPGLKLSVDGRDNWPGYNFIWPQGSTHQVSAPATQFDSSNRQYTFQKWSNTSGPSQTVNIDQAAVDNGVRFIATYSVLSRVLVQTSPGGLSVQVDGTSCQSPCTIDRTNGTQLRVTAPTTVPMGDGARLDFQGWSDGGASDHTFTINSDTTTITANYQPSYRLSAAGDPGNGASFQFDPGSSDGFYPQGTNVAVSVTANPGFKFRRWDGDLSGTYPVGAVSMTTPHSVLAHMDRVPYIAPAGVRNAVGDTPSSAVAPGSIVTISGESLAPDSAVGRVNPLSQTILGVTVTVNDRILGLLYVSPQQINAQIPSDLPAGDYTLQVHSTGQPDVSATFSVVRNAPGIFLQNTNSQQYAMALHDDGSLVTPDSPARAGETISLLGTGFGPYNGVVIDGFFPPDPPPSLADSVSVSAGGQTPSNVWSGAAPGFTGLTVTKFTVPDGLPSGTMVPVNVSVNGASSNTVMLPLQ